MLHTYMYVAVTIRTQQLTCFCAFLTVSCCYTVEHQDSVLVDRSYAVLGRALQRLFFEV